MTDVPTPDPDWILEVRQWLQDRDNAAAVSAAKDAEIAALRQYLDAAQRRGEELRAQVAALEGDAGRYRWLRDKLDVSDQAAWNIFMSEGVDQWDAAIDAARKGAA